jgi:hypothetical protein
LRRAKRREERQTPLGETHAESGPEFTHGFVLVRYNSDFFPEKKDATLVPLSLSPSLSQRDFDVGLSSNLWTIITTYKTNSLYLEIKDIFCFLRINL